MKTNKNSTVKQFQGVGNSKTEKLMSSSPVKKYALTTALFLSQLAVTAAAPDIKTQLTTWNTTVDDALTVLVSIFAIIGGFLVFIQYMQGNDQAQKNLIKFVIGLAVFGVAKILVTTFVTPGTP